MPSGVYVRTKEIREKISISHKGKKLSEETKTKMKKAHLGKKLSKEHKLKISFSKIGNKCACGSVRTEEFKISARKLAYKGELAGVAARHLRIVKKYGKPNKCEICGTTENRRYEWSNKDHKYSDNIKDWQRLCMPCHHKFDTKYNNRKH